MNIPGITWRGESIDDVEILSALPRSLVDILRDTNGFILHDGALHMRGACQSPEWHSLRAIVRGSCALHILYERVHSTDIPFAQDQVGDQYILRENGVFRLSAESGEIEPVVDCLDDFFRLTSADIEEFLDVGLGHSLLPGELLLANPPFIFRESGAGTSLKPSPANEVILFHAKLAREIRDIPDGGQVTFKIT